MPVHIGQIIKSLVEEKKLTQKEFGLLIHKHPKTIPNIYGRTNISSELLLTISAALNTDLFQYFYQEDPLKSLRNDEVKKLQEENQELKKVADHLNKELKDKQDIIEMQKFSLNIMDERMEEYKNQKKDQSKNS